MNEKQIKIEFIDKLEKFYSKKSYFCNKYDLLIYQIQFYICLSHYDIFKIRDVYCLNVISELNQNFKFAKIKIELITDLL